MDTIKTITSEQYETLESYQEFFTQARLGYIRGLYSYDVAKLKVIYESLGHRLGSPSCGACVLEMCKVLGDYFEQYNKTQDHSKELAQLCRDIKDKKTNSSNG